MIGLANIFSLPVSTTHVLSSGVAGTMVANKSGLQGGTVKTILLAWILTLPATVPCRPACSGWRRRRWEADTALQRKRRVP